jgi:hypothetical protein
MFWGTALRSLGVIAALLLVWLAQALYAVYVDCDDSCDPHEFLDCLGPSMFPCDSLLVAIFWPVMGALFVGVLIAQSARSALMGVFQFGALTSVGTAIFLSRVFLF